MLWHIGAYVEKSGDVTWLSQHWKAVKRAGSFLEKKFDADMKLIWGEEEAEISRSRKVRFSLHMSSVCALGLAAAKKLAVKMGESSLAGRWQRISHEILSVGIPGLWDDDEGTFAFGLTESGVRVTSPALWMTLMPFWLFNRFDDKLPDTLRYLRRKLYDKDLVIPKTYWFYDYSPFVHGDTPMKNQYSGAGVTIGGLPVLVDALLKAGDIEHAEEQISNIVAYTNPENRLLPEHINTITPGKTGNYSVYPDPYYYVDSGNLLHLSFFLTLIARRDPAMLRRASDDALKMGH